MLKFISEILVPPYKNDSQSSVEGQVDYFTTRYCLPKVLNFLLRKNPVIDDPLRGCKSEVCKRIFMGIKAEIAVMQFHLPHQPADIFEHDSHVVESVDAHAFFYPSNQCRLDTLVEGALESERPRCWWVAE